MAGDSRAAAVKAAASCSKPACTDKEAETREKDVTRRLKKRTGRQSPTDGVSHAE